MGLWKQYTMRYKGSYFSSWGYHIDSTSNNLQDGYRPAIFDRTSQTQQQVFQKLGEYC